MNTALDGLRVVDSKHALFKFEWVNDQVVFLVMLPKWPVFIRSSLEATGAIHAS